MGSAPARADAPAPPRLTDIGGVPLAGGGQIRRGRVFRISGQIVTPEQLEALRQAGVAVVVDLRGQGEDRSVLREWADRAGIAYQPEPIDAAGSAHLADRARLGDAEEAAEAMRDIYLWIVDHSGPQVAATLSVIAQGKTTGFGCAAGRDRTGIVTGVLHALLGATTEAIADSYAGAAPAADLLRPTMRSFFALGPDDALPAGAEVMLGAREEWILGALAHVDSAYGGPAAYLERHGLRSDEVAALRRLLVVDV